MSTADQTHGIPAQLRAARIENSLAISALATELKLPRAVLEAMENGDWARLGAPVFARHLISRYAGRLGISVDIDEVAARLPSPELRSQVPVARFGGMADFLSRNVGYLTGTVLVIPLIIGVFAFMPSTPGEYRSLDPSIGPVPARFDAALPVAAIAPPADAAADGTEPAASAVTQARDSAEAQRAAAELLASAGAIAQPEPVEARLPATPTVAAGLAPNLLGGGRDQIEFSFSGDSWIEVFNRDGAAIDRVLARAGEDRSYRLSAVGRVTIGNVDATRVRIDGSDVNLDTVRAANVARFALSSDGSIEAVAR